MQEYMKLMLIAQNDTILKSHIEALLDYPEGSYFQIKVLEIDIEAVKSGII
jgi:hypothetical protein